MANASDPKKPRWSRRRFLKWGLGAAAAGLVGGPLYAWRVEPHWIEVVRRDLPIARLPASLAGRTLAFISDLHIGPVVNGDYIRAAMRRVNALKPDLLALGGDLMTARHNEQVDRTLDVISVLSRPPLGAFAVLGNHDYGYAWQYPAVAAALADGLGKLGVTVLRNAMATVEGLQIAGLDDVWGHDPGLAADRSLPGGGDFDMPRPGESFSTGGSGFFAPERVLPKLDRGRAALVLAHNPDVADLPVWGDYRGWILCGHTHGGQVDLPLIGPPMLPTSNKRYVEGEYDAGGGRTLYITRGLGYLRRVRFCSRPEITLFTLRRANDSAP